MLLGWLCVFGMRWRWVVACGMVGVVGVLASGLLHAGGSERELGADRVAKHVILMIGDGMGPQQVRAAGLYLYGRGGRLNFERFPGQAMMMTHSASDAVTDSAAAATAMATGVKVDNKVLSVALPGDGGFLPTVLELCKAKGKRVGLVTTTQITHATPAAFGAHGVHRDHRRQIGLDYLQRSRPHVLFGGGDKGLDVKMVREDGRYTLVENREQLLAIATDRVVYVAGLFGVGHLPYEYDYSLEATDANYDPGYATLPHLSEMTRVALDLLDNDADGFFLMVEGGRIDHAGHGSHKSPELARLKTGRNVFETIAFAQAVAVVLDWAAEHDPGFKQTLILVTADHETGDLSVTQQSAVAGRLPAVVWGSRHHTGVNVPLAGIGVGWQRIRGVMDNTGLLAVMMGWP